MQYVNTMKEDQKDIYYLAAPTRELAENSPYYEGLKKKETEVLFCYEPYDELVLLQLGMFMGKNLVSVEKEMRQDKGGDNLDNLSADSLRKSEIDDLGTWIKEKLSGKVTRVKVKMAGD